MRLWPSLLLLCLAGVPAGALAQGDSAGSAQTLKLIVDACITIVGSDPKVAQQQLTDSGWTPNEISDTGPYNAVYSGFRNLPPYGQIDLWGSIQRFPSQRLGYCRADFGDTDNVLDFSVMAGISGLVGSIDARDGGDVYGAWESPDKRLLLIGDRTAGAVEFEFNLLPGPALAQ